MTIDLSPYSAIQAALFCKIEIPGEATVLISDYDREITIGGDTYSALGQFMSITESTSELRLNNAEISITLSGIPNTEIADFMSQPVKGSKVTVIRGIFAPNTGTLLAIAGNPVGKFKGVVNNYAIIEEHEGLVASSTIELICKSQVGLIQGRIAGRRTNPADQRAFAPNDPSMDRVPSLANAKINFGGV